MNILKDNPVTPYYYGNKALKKSVSTLRRAIENLIKVKQAYKLVNSEYLQLLNTEGSNIPLVINADSTKAGDLAVSTSAGIKFYRNYNSTVEGTPIGVVVIPASHRKQLTGEDKNTIMSLCNMSWKTPETGTLDIENAESNTGANICWGYYNPSNALAQENLLELTKSNAVIKDVEGSTLGIQTDGKVTSDFFDTYKNQYGVSLYMDDDWGVSGMYFGAVLSKKLDNGLSVLSGYHLFNMGDFENGVYQEPELDSSSSFELSAIIFSPYLENGDLNPDFLLALNERDLKDTATFDFDGKGNTDKIMSFVTVPMSEEVDKTFKSDNYPAAICCRRFHTEGTNIGDWYLPSLGEMIYIANKLGTINKTLNILDNAVPVGDAVTADTYGYWLWTSTGGSYYDAWRFYCGYDGCSLDWSIKDSQGGDVRVRALMLV